VSPASARISAGSTAGMATSAAAVRRQGIRSVDVATCRAGAQVSAGHYRRRRGGGGNILKRGALPVTMSATRACRSRWFPRALSPPAIAPVIADPSLLRASRPRPGPRTAPRRLRATILRPRSVWDISTASSSSGAPSPGQRPAAEGEAARSYALPPRAFIVSPRSPPHPGPPELHRGRRSPATSFSASAE